VTPSLVACPVIEQPSRLSQLSVIIVSWNTRDLLEQCLLSLAAATAHDDSVQVVVVDNASTDGSADMVQMRFPEVLLIRNPANIGFAAANNQAYARCQGRYILLLNPDTRLHPGSIAALTNFMEGHPAAGASGPMLLNPDGTLQTSCYPAPTLGRELWRLMHLDTIKAVGAYRMSEWDLRQPRRVDVVMGACVLLRRSTLEQVGFLDEGYFIYSEEVDLLYRTAGAHWETWWVPESRVVHYGGQSTRQVATAMFVRLYGAKLRYFRKNHGPWSARAYKVVLALAALPRLALVVPALACRGAARARYVGLAGRYAQLMRALPSL
jgi:GT2 family glycosyltransferase